MVHFYNFCFAKKYNIKKSKESTLHGAGWLGHILSAATPHIPSKESKHFLAPCQEMWNLKLSSENVILRLRDLPGGGFTEIARFIWEKYRLPDITMRCCLQQYHHLKTHSLQVKVEACRPGRVEHCRSTGTLASSAASLQMELPHMDGSFTPHCCVP